MVIFFSILTRHALCNQTLFILSDALLPGMVVTVKAWQQPSRIKIINFGSEPI